MDAIRVKSIKRAQKEALLYREISTLFLKITLEDARLQELFINRVSLSPDKGMCSIFFYTDRGEAGFQELMEILVLYKPSLRKALSSRIPSRYVPNLLFKFDTKFEKHQRIEQLLETIKTEEPSSEEPS